tara:strand:+ start:777 stop:893 length:117 start_codon:yes stop_codon:yes gene_type:complete
MFKNYNFYANQKTVKLKPSDDRAIKKEKFAKIKLKITK